MASFQKVVDGLLRVARQSDEVTEHTFLPPVELSSKLTVPDAASDWAAAQFTADGAHRSIVIASDKTVDPHEKLEAWFNSFDKPVRRRPIYAHHKNLGAVPEEKPEEEKKSQESADITAFNAKAKAKAPRIYQKSPSYGCIILIDGRKAVPYQPDTINQLGNHQAPRFSTAVEWRAQLYDTPEMRISFNVCFGENMLTYASAIIPLHALTSTPTVLHPSAEEVQVTMGRLRMPAEQTSGAWNVRFVINTTPVRLTYSAHVFRDLQALQMPYLHGLRRDVDRAFEQPVAEITFFVTEEWKDFFDSATRLQKYFDIAFTDVHQSLMTYGPLVTRRDVKLTLPKEASRVPAKMVFKDSDEWLVTLSDGIAREHRYQEYLTKQLTAIDVKGIMIPVGRQKCRIERRNGTSVERPFVFSVHITTASNMKLLAEVMPALGSSVKLQIDVPYTAVDVPIDNKTDGEIAVMITSSLHAALWNHRRPRDDRLVRDKLWVADFKDIILRYIDQDTLCGLKSDPEKVKESLALLLANDLQKVRADKKTERKAETASEHRERVQASVKKYARYMKMPTDVTGNVPQFHASRYAFADALGQLSEYQFLVKRPRYMNWPRSMIKNNPPPFLDFTPPALPRSKWPVSNFVSTLLAKPDQFAVNLKVLDAFDELTTKAKEAGLLEFRQHRDTRYAKWFTNFVGQPLLWDATDTFSILGRVMHYLYFDEANGIDTIEDETLTFPEPVRDKDGVVIHATTPEFQIRENRITRAMLAKVRSFSEDQKQAIKRLQKLPFGCLVIEGVPGSGKTTVAQWILIGILGSAYDETKLNRSYEQDIAPKPEVDNQDVELESLDDEDPEYRIRPGLESSLQPETAATDDTVDDSVQDDEAKEWDYLCDLPALTLGPTAKQIQKLVIDDNTPTSTEFPVEDPKIRCLLRHAQRIFDANVQELRGKLTGSDNKQAFDFKWHKHWQQWKNEAIRAIQQDLDTAVVITKDEPHPDNAAAEDNRDPAVADLEHELGLSADDEPSIPQLKCYPKVMIIANQNINRDDLAHSLDALHREVVGEQLAIVKVNNLDSERDQLMRSYLPDRDEDITEDITMADILDAGIDEDSITDFSYGRRQFGRQHRGGVFRLEAILRAQLAHGQNESLARELRLMADPNEPFDRDRQNRMKRSIDHMIREILTDADVVVCTFVIAQKLHNRKLFAPIVVHIDEASREHEANVRWAMLGLDPQMLILTGDYRQDRPFCLSGNAGMDGEGESKFHFNPFSEQFQTSLSRRMMAAAPEWMIYLTENHRQAGGLHDIPSQLFYRGTMTSSRGEADEISLMWLDYGQQLVTKYRASRPRKERKEDRAADHLTGNRITMLVKSSQQQIGTSPINRIQAEIAVEQAAAIHQSGTPGGDLQRPTICIITPYAAQRAIIQHALNKLSPQEICKERVFVRTQTSATGGEWDVVINVFVREAKMGFLGDSWRMNVMMTRPIYWSLDILDEKLWEKPEGRGAHYIYKYRQEQQRNGAIIRDLVDRQQQICPRCLSRHGTGCEAEVVCFVCREGHHARKCPKKVPMTVDITGAHSADAYITDEVQAPEDNETTGDAHQSGEW